MKKNRNSLFRSGGYCLSTVLLLAVVTSGGAFGAPPDHAQGKPPPHANGAKKPPLVLESYGFFIAGGQLVAPTTDSVTRTGLMPLPLAERRILVGQAYVDFWIPHKKRPNSAPVIMTHSARSGVFFLTTPDGREGWSHFFVRSGFPVYVVDPPGQGRAGFPVDAFNKVHDGLEPPSTQPRLIHGDSSEWETFWIGPRPQELGDGNFYGNQMPTDADSFRNWLQPGSIPRGVPVPGSEEAFIAVLEKIAAPVIWIGWSAGGGLGQILITERPDLFRAFVGVESTGCDVVDPQVIDALVTNNIPFLSIQGGASAARPSGLPVDLAGRCQPTVDAIKAAGGNATQLQLPDAGIFGNSHQMMSEKNSDEIAQVILDWIDANVGKDDDSGAKGPK